jgi:hypothetical protein
MPPPPPLLPNRGNFCLAREGVRGRVRASGRVRQLDRFSPGLSGLVSNSPPPSGSRERGLPFECCSLMPWDRQPGWGGVGWGGGMPVDACALGPARNLRTRHLALSCQEPARLWEYRTSFSPLPIVLPLSPGENSECPGNGIALCSNDPCLSFSSRVTLSRSLTFG